MNIFTEFKHEGKWYQIITDDNIVFELMCDGLSIHGKMTSLSVIRALSYYLHKEDYDESEN